MKKNSLGKGLGAIFTDLGSTASRPSFVMCGIEELAPNRFQPRKAFEGGEIRNLVASIRKNGIIQPIIARRTGAGRFEIIAGERRWRAAQAAGLKDVPVIIREAEDIDVAELSLIENLQREELNPVEEAEAYHTLSATFHLSQEEISSRVGKDRSTITNALRLLKLPDDVRGALIEKIITAGHARALLALDSRAEQSRLLKHIMDKKLSVRDTERLVKKTTNPKTGVTRAKGGIIVDIEEQLTRRLMAKTTIRERTRGGTIEITYTSGDELDRLINLLLERNSR